jgi:hypothetical protein
MGKLFQELKRRKVFRIAGVYAVGGCAWFTRMVIEVANWNETNFNNAQLAAEFVIAVISVTVAQSLFPLNLGLSPLMEQSERLDEY